MSDRPRLSKHMLSAVELELLDIIIEECAEVIQAATKIKRFGKMTEWRGVCYDNEFDLGLEVGDLRCVTDLAIQHGLTSTDAIEAGRIRKLVKLPIFSSLIQEKS